MSENTEQVQNMMLAGLRALGEQEQKELVMLGCNAKFVLRMLENLDTPGWQSTEPGKTVLTIVAALKRGIPSLGGEDL